MSCEILCFRCVHYPTFDIKATRILSFNLPAGAFLTVASYTPIARPDGVFLTVAGKIQADGEPANFTQTFVLQLIDTKHWITLDALVVCDGAPVCDDSSFRAADETAAPKKPKERPPTAKRAPGRREKGQKG
jgi:hypothetical protein